MDLITKQPGVFNAHVGAFVTGGTDSAATAKKATEKAEQGEEEEQEQEEGVIFTYEVLSGPCHRSFGINVAACSGFPASVVSSARRALRNIKAAAAAAGVAGDRNWLKSDETAQGRGGKRKGKRNGKKKEEEKEKRGEERRSRKQRRTTPGQQSSSEEEKALLSAAEEAKAFLDEMRTMREPLRGMEDAVAASVIGAFAAKARLVAERAGQGVLSLS